MRKVKRVYGPYIRKDGRKHVVLWYGNKDQRTMSYPKWIMSQKLGKELKIDDTVDHIDRDFSNNITKNLQVLPRSRHAYLDVKRAVTLELHCPWCNRTFIAARRTYNRAIRLGRAGLFCSRVCAGKYGAKVQNGGHRIGPGNEVPLIYYKLSK